MKHALISVSDKTHLVEFAKLLVARGVRIISTGGTSKALKTAGLPVTEIGEFTGFPEIMDGRVRTLHPKVHAALLARQNVKEDFEILESLGVPPLDLIVVNLYPFENALTQNLPYDELIEYIDIGGPTMLRAAAKNFERVTVVCDPSDYERILQDGANTFEFRKALAAKVFAHTAYYDTLIAQNFLRTSEPKEWSVAGKLFQSLRYGENPQQKAWWLTKAGAINGLHSAEVLQGKQLSYNNLLDLQAAVHLVRKLQSPGAVVVKHNNPCGVAIGSNTTDAVQRALAADPVSAFGGIIAINGRLEASAARELTSLFLECIIAKDIAEDAAEILRSKKNLRVLKWPHFLKMSPSYEVRAIDGGWLVQETDQVEEQWDAQWKIYGAQLPEKQKLDLLLAWKTVASLKSNAISIVEGGQTLGLGMGQVNRVDAVKQALDRAQRFTDRLPQAVLASDAFFPFADSIESLAQFGIRYVIQPGGSVKDADVLAAAERLGVTMVFTGKRHFWH